MVETKLNDDVTKKRNKKLKILERQLSEKTIQLNKIKKQKTQ